jgi:hypothetical protein
MADPPMPVITTWRTSFQLGSSSRDPSFQAASICPGRPSISESISCGSIFANEAVSSRFIDFLLFLNRG